MKRRRAHDRRTIERGCNFVCHNDSNKKTATSRGIRSRMTLYRKKPKCGSIHSTRSASKCNATRVVTTRCVHGACGVKGGVRRGLDMPAECTDCQSAYSPLRKQAYSGFWGLPYRCMIATTKSTRAQIPSPPRVSSFMAPIPY